MRRLFPHPRYARRHTLAGLCLLIFAVFLIWPIALTVVGGFVERTAEGEQHWTLYYLLSVLRDSVAREGLANSLLIAIATTLLSFLLGVPLAILSTSYEFRGKTLLLALLLVPLILPSFVGAIGFQQIMGRYGTLNALLIDWGLVAASNPIDFLGGARLWGVVIMEALHLYPIAI